MTKQRYVVYIVRGDIPHLEEMSNNSFKDSSLERVTNGNAWSAFCLSLSEDELLLLKLSVDYLYIATQ